MYLDLIQLLPCLGPTPCFHTKAATWITKNAKIYIVLPVATVKEFCVFPAKGWVAYSLWDIPMYSPPESCKLRASTNTPKHSSLFLSLLHKPLRKTTNFYPVSFNAILPSLARINL